MKPSHILSIAVLALASNTVMASCYGTGTYQTCTDDSGNTYSVNRLGNNTYMEGRNPQTGSTWSQETYRSGNTSNTYGRDANGNSWSSSTYKNGNSTTTYGTDSNGRSFTRTCNQFGCF